jgi:hypothetical protein
MDSGVQLALSEIPSGSTTSRPEMPSETFTLSFSESFIPFRVEA